MDLTALTCCTWHMDGDVGVLTLNRPERLNAIANTDIDELDRVLAYAGKEPSVRAVVITGAGRGFCSGADVKEWAAKADAAEESWAVKMHRTIARLYWLPKPVIAAVNGVAAGSGFDIALTADMRFASTAARFGQVYTQRGICPDAGGSYLLPRIVGETRAAELIYTGRIIDADEALRIGVVSDVVPPEELMDRALEQARIFAAGPTVAIGEAKRNIRAGHTLGIEEALRNEHRGALLCVHTEDKAEGLAAAIEKRRPVFVGR
ncbi:2-(1,2-epoxy-1,2-dihydrophenyl)acetyl-CoA isomerase [Actinomadura pelletieri DSM 43383]|uniref:enoyl-CoA hydratase n=1 Tax=Actinomadura pelletieri DSM 43383 TaxID=1120940 RepID=A0A495QXR3_9ACTN|nr:enoyl-CoA hydratase-related protein [Actinomadura pelletieri]RKS78971.1 2-(1,2-epoxy-1,2-dihydrophenyl)acetyl-CoA isomerase [Actinomadura pelletieri DSM 43383]